MVTTGIIVNKKGIRIENKVVGNVPSEIWQKTINGAKEKSQYKAKDGSIKQGFIRIDFSTGELYTVKTIGLDPQIKKSRDEEREKRHKAKEELKEKKRLQRKKNKEQRQKDKELVLSKKIALNK